MHTYVIKSSVHAVVCGRRVRVASFLVEMR